VWNGKRRRWSLQLRGRRRRDKPRHTDSEGLDFRSLNRGRLGNNRHRLSRLGLKHFVGHIRQPMDAAILIFGSERGKNQLREQIETANVLICESPGSSRERLQHAQLLAPATQRNQHGSASSYLAGKPQFDAGIDLTIVATKNA